MIKLHFYRFPLLPVPLWARVVVPVIISSTGEIDMFKIYSYLMGIPDAR